MNTASHNKLVSFIWSIADDCLRDVYVRGKYRDVILPMVVLRRLDALLEPTKVQVLQEYTYQKQEMGLTILEDYALCNESHYVFYNISEWTLKQIYDTATNSQQLLEANFQDYLNGFSDNVKEIIKKFNLPAQIRHMAAKDVLYDVLGKFTSPYINLTPNEVLDPDGNKLPALSNLGMGYVFEELIRKFNEENNEEAGEHFTPREVIELMTHLVIEPIKDQLPPVITIYDPACGSGGMLTEAQNFIIDPDGIIKASSDVYLYGKEINDETYAICKSDMMIKGNDPKNIKNGSTLATDEFAGSQFDFMLSNPPYGKSWASDQKYIKDGKDVIDPRFKVNLPDYWGNVTEEDATPRSSDGQLLFLMEMVSKMKGLSDSPNGARIASVHNGSSLFTGDAGSGESNIRRYVIENDLLEAIVQLPNNLFYNTGITTYIWLLSNNKTESRRGKVQLIDASQLYRKLRKNLGNKNCEFSPEHIEQILQTYLNLTTVEHTTNDEGIAAKVLANQDFGYYKVTIERPLRLKAQFSAERLASLRFDKSLQEPMQWAYEQWGEALYTDVSQHKKAIEDWCEQNEFTLNSKNRKKLLDPATWSDQKALLELGLKLMECVGTDEFRDFNVFSTRVDEALKALSVKLSASERNSLLNAVSWYDAGAEKVIKAKVKLSGDKLDKVLNYLGCTRDQLADFGYYSTGKADEFVQYESSSEWRDSESVPLGESIHEYFLREVKPDVEEAWINLESVKVGYEISFNKYFYRHQPLRSLEAVAADILALEQQSDGLIVEILGL